jgi:Big-like domain-containing protein
MPARVRLSRHRSKSTRSQLTFERLEERFVLNGQAILGNDVFSLHENGPQATLHVLANDVFDADYAGNRLITSVSFGSQGGRLSVAADKQTLVYTPPADFFGVETFTYAVDSAYTAQVSVTLDTPLVSDDFTVTPNGQTRQLDVMANDPFWANYTGPRNITAVSVGSAGGTVAISADRKSILYTSPDDVMADETFTYVVDELYPARVTIHTPSTLSGDSYDLVQHAAPTTLSVLDNDPFWQGYTGAKKITHVTQGWRGATITISSDGKSLLYTQPADFGDDEFSYVLYDSFEYVVDGVSHAGVSVGLLRPVKDDSFEMDQDGGDQSFNVAQNDRYGGSTGDAFDVIDRVTSVTQSVKGGTVSISPDGQSVIYTPAPGFSGTDTFTYTADGLYVGRVTIEVTRPVRDDILYTDVYQDTPNNPVDVLANDFLSTGYGGQKLITSVGPTEHGGTVTIRNDGKALLYTPAAGYTGEDRFTYTVDGTLQAEVTINVTALAQIDQERFYPEPSQRPYTIDVLKNDNFGHGYLGPGAITSAEVVDGTGLVTVRNDGKLLFNPASAGAYTIRYVVDGQYESSVFVWVVNVAFADQLVADENSSEQRIDVLMNDFYLNYYPDYYSYQGPRIITGVTQSQHGGTVTIAADGHSVNYKPPADFFGTDSFTYTVDSFMTATVSVEVIRRVRDDVFRVDAADGPQSLPVLVNDLFGANYSGPGQITAVTSPAALQRSRQTDIRSCTSHERDLSVPTISSTPSTDS